MDLVALDDYLSSHDSPDGCMMLSDLDGFMHGVACSPVEVPAREWMLHALGTAPNEVPAWVTKMIGDLYLAILDGLESEPAQVDPLFWDTEAGHVIAMDWCEGFMEAVALRPQDWQHLTDSEQGRQMMLPIVTHIFDEDGNSALGIPAGQLEWALDEASKAIPEAVVDIFRFWQKTTRHNYFN